MGIPDYKHRSSHLAHRRQAGRRELQRGDQGPAPGAGAWPELGPAAAIDPAAGEDCCVRTGGHPCLKKRAPPAAITIPKALT